MPQWIQLSGSGPASARTVPPIPRSTYGTDLPSAYLYNAGVSFVPGGTGLRQSNKDSKLNSTPVLNDQAVFNVFMI